EQRIAGEEQSRPKTIDRGREHEIAIHGERRERDIRPIEAIEKIEHSDEGNEPPGAFYKNALVTHPCLCSSAKATATGATLRTTARTITDDSTSRKAMIIIDEA